MGLLTRYRNNTTMSKATKKKKSHMDGAYKVQMETHPPPTHTHLVELLLAVHSFQNFPILPFSVLPAVKDCTLLWQRPLVNLVLRRKIGSPEFVGVLVSNFQKELESKQMNQNT